ncbi:hypothetical protein P3W45_001394 [Vairimorpha bombi]|jgi:hypothetical protein
MTFTLLTQQEIDQIPNIIYKKIVIEHTNVLELNKTLNQTTLANQYTINDLNKQISMHKNSLYNINLSKHFLEIENEMYKQRVESISRVLLILEKDPDIEKKVSSRTGSSRNESTNTSTSGTSSVLQKLIRKIKTLTKKNRTQSSKYKSLIAEYLKIVKSKDELYEEYTRNLVDSKKLTEYHSLLERCTQCEKGYYQILDQYNKIDYEYKKICFEYRDIKYKYTRYVLTNRDDIIPVIGNELDGIKDSIHEFTKLSGDLDVSNIFNEYWRYIDKLKDRINHYKNIGKYRDVIQSEVDIMRSLINNIYTNIDSNMNLYTLLNKEINTLSELIKDIYKNKIGDAETHSINHLLMEIYNYKKELRSKEKMLEEFKKEIDTKTELLYKNEIMFENFKKEIENKTELLLDKYKGEINLDTESTHNKEILLDNYKKELDSKTDLINTQANIIQEKDSKIQKLIQILTKLKKVKEEYINLKKNLDK